MKKFIIGLVFTIIVLFGLYLFHYNGGDNSTSMDTKEPFFNDQAMESADPEKAYLFDPNSETANGLAKRAFAMGKFVHTINIDLPDLKEGETYEGWLVKGDKSEKTVVCTGKLLNLNNEYFLVFETDQDLRSFEDIIVTKQAASESGPGKTVAQGKF